MSASEPGRSPKPSIDIFAVGCFASALPNAMSRCTSSRDIAAPPGLNLKSLVSGESPPWSADAVEPVGAVVGRGAVEASGAVVAAGGGGAGVGDPTVRAGPRAPDAGAP